MDGSADGLLLQLVGANPARDVVRFNVSLDAPGPATLAIYDALGRAVARQSAAGGETTVDVGRLARGVYVAGLEPGGRSAVRRFTVAC